MSLRWMPDMFRVKSVYCPVGEHKKLGEIISGEITSLACIDCGWLFTWGTDGKLLNPVPLHPAKPKGCNCESCKYRDSNKEKK